MNAVNDADKKRLEGLVRAAADIDRPPAEVAAAVAVAEEALPILDEAFETPCRLAAAIGLAAARRLAAAGKLRGVRR